jgi:hypothetical protein
VLNLNTERLRDDAAYREDAQHHCFTDLSFMAQVMGLKPFHPVLHKPVMDFYFPKNPKISIEDQSPIKKNFLHLDPRLTWKTTAARTEKMQWLTAFPELITLVNESATQKLAQAISKEGLADYFWKPKGAPATLFQLVFPDLVVEKEPFSNKDKWNTPNHQRGTLDSTLAFTSPGSVQSGWHPYILNVDDMVETTNSGKDASPDARQSVINTYNTNMYTLQPGGYIYVIGTRYHPEDLYGRLIDTMDPDTWKVLIRESITVKSGARMMPGEFPGEDDCIVNFAGLPGMDYKSLRKKFYDDYEAFMCQQQNDPQGGNLQVFDENLFLTMQTAPDRVPAMGETFCCWRFPYGGKDFMESAEGVAARVWEGKVYILDAWSGKYTPSRLAEKIVKECKVHQTNLIMTEDFPGIHYMEAHIRNESLKKNTSVNIQWLDFEDDDNQRLERIRQMEPQARAGKILISQDSGKFAEIRRQLLNLGLTSGNGIVDCISRMTRKIPVSLFRKELEDEEAEMQVRRRHNVMAHFVYGDDAGIQELEDRKAQEAEAHRRAFERTNTFQGLTDTLGGLDG